MPATATRKQPAQKIIPAKTPAKAKTSQKPPARTAQEWKDEEANETDGQSLRGAVNQKATTPEQIVVNDNYCIGNWGLPSWADEDGNRFSVNFWFPTQKVAIDYPESQDELEMKAAVLKKLKVPYIGVLPGEPLRVDEARAQLRAQGAKI